MKYEVLEEVSFYMLTNLDLRTGRIYKLRQGLMILRFRTFSSE